MRTFILSITTLFASVFIFSSCSKNKSEPQPCTYDSCATKAPASEILAVQHYLDSAGITATQHCSGLFYTIETAGAGNAPNACQDIGVRYKGMLTNGNVFDSSNQEIPLNLGFVIQGWRNTVPMLKQGGKMTLYIPPTLGYGKDPQYNPRKPTEVLIPGNSILIFNVELVAVYE
ncbi:MAG TPA: FKBP-type peptidyl-prolyl cis-trans isomerase [Niastella sp.]|nr:FKBP-type peptidyl-prolyl cis-trans isomerase [Niastella sp.]